MPDKRSVLRDKFMLWLRFQRELGIETLERTGQIRAFLGQGAHKGIGVLETGPSKRAHGSGGMGSVIGMPLEGDAALLLAQGSLSDTRALLGDCKRCELHKKRTNIVFGEGPGDASLFIVGEAPGRQEDVDARPFVGPSGVLLTKMLKAINIARASVYITSVVKCRPPDNRTPRPGEIASCLPFLSMQIKAVSPKFILAMGQTAAKTLLDIQKTVNELRGAFHPLRLNKVDVSGIKVLVTYHPAYILRHGGDRQKSIKLEAWRDLQMLQKEYEKIS